MNDKKETSDTLDGLEQIADLVHRCRVIEDYYLTASTSKPELEIAITKVYGEILGYQMKAACYFDRNTASRAMRNIMTLDNWIL